MSRNITRTVFSLVSVALDERLNIVGENYLQGGEETFVESSAWWFNVISREGR